ncbi:hypothetical protein O6H91_07G013800 [Diphasiastrum complanatum]|uniref:Uncharacterized protein n=1 Tax=Diphasiastrum complanatum TaxID=34168 RepID=A0ACC2D3G8_DIPCM|nr:hypothetical protein O6H91_07G013800 [Diphasiastrum complanatum]
MDCEESPSTVQTWLDCQGEICRFSSPIEASAEGKVEFSDQTIALNAITHEIQCYVTHPKDQASLCCTSLNVEEKSSSTFPELSHISRPSTEQVSFTVDHKSELKVSGPTSHSKTVYVWDLDETLIIFQTLSTCKFAEAYKGSKDIKQGVKLGRKWESLILKVCDEFCFYEQVEDYNEPNIAALSQYDDGANLADYNFNADEIRPPFTDSERRKLAYRHRWIKNIYSQGLEKLLKDDTLQEWKELYEATDQYTNGWLSAGRSLLEECSNSSKSTIHENRPNGSLTCMAGDEDIYSNRQDTNCNINVVVTSGTLVPSLVKCLLFRLNTFIDSVNVYSSREAGKLQCFRWIKERFEAPNVRFCAIGDGLDECEAAETLTWPFVKVDLRPDSPHCLLKVTAAVVKQYISVVYGDLEE